jgi:DNA-binding transcriptional LysR family regulator
MHVTLRQLSVFEAVARHLSFTRAAEELHMSQPAVSMQIRQLEDNLGLPLLDRLGKRIYLTEAGRRMHHYCRAIAQQLAEAETVMQELKGLRGGHLNIAVATTANYFATQLLATFCKRLEGITFSLDVTNRETLLRQLAANEQDLVIMGKPPEDLDLAAEPFMDNPLVVIAAPEHPLVDTAVGLGRLQREPFVVREKGSGTRIAMERFFAQADVSLSTGMELSSNEAIKQAVEAGLGLGIVSLHTVALELQTARLRILQAEGFPILRKWYVVYPRGKKLSTVAKAFLSFLHDEGRRIAQSLLPQLNAGVPLAAEPGRVVTAEQSSSRTRNAR